MKNFIRKHQSFVSYTFFGTLASGVNLIVFHILYQNIGINYVVANVISYICGMLVTFFTNKRLVFHSEYDSVKKLLEKELIEKDLETGFLRTTNIWWNEFVNFEIGKISE